MNQASSRWVTDYQTLRQSGEDKLGLQEAFPSYISDGGLNQKRGKNNCQSSKNKSKFKNGQKIYPKTYTDDGEKAHEKMFTITKEI